MKKEKLYLITLVAVVVMGLAFAGCKSKKTEEAGKEAAPAATEKAGGEKAAPAGEVKTMGDLCKKYVDETKAANNGNLPAEAEKAALDSCMSGAKAMEASPMAKEMTEKYIGEIMKACEGKSGEEWVKCYADEAPKAMQSSMK